MTIDEAIAHAREKAEYFKTTTNVAYALELKQIAEWLEELKELRKIKEDYAKGMQTSYATFMYNKAIDDFAEKLKAEYKPCEKTDEEIYKKVCIRIEKIAKQLKEGGEDD